MSYTAFTDEQIQSFRAASAEKHDGRVTQLDITDPIATSIVVAPFNRAEYGAFWDKRERDQQTAFRGVMLSQLVWPGLVEIESLRQEWATLPARIAEGLQQEAGAGDSLPVVQPLDPLSPPKGMTSAEATKLIAASPRAKLWSVERADVGLSCVLETPPADTMIAAVALHGDACDRHKNIIGAIEPWILGAMKWTAAPLDGGQGLLDLKPAVIWDLWYAYKRMGGAGATVRRKSL